MQRASCWLGGACLLVGWGEWLNRRWSRMLVTDEWVGVTEVVVVLGYRNRQERINAINRWRVRIGIRSVSDSDTRVIFSGGATAGESVEAQLMAVYARSVLGFDGQVLIEDQSSSTWENVANVIALLEDADRIKIASQPGHALKARAYLRRQRPDLAARLAPAQDYRFGEWFPLKPLLAAYGLWTLRGLATAERSPLLVRLGGRPWRPAQSSRDGQPCKRA
jgi:uncharacterized SAM-binding protein YcdF (DUF218 family)